MKLSENLPLSEMIKSDTAIRRGIDNTPTTEHLVNMTIWANRIFQPMRDHFGCPIHISSGYRGKLLNEAAGGSPSSFHCFGECGDIDQDNKASEITNFDIFHYAYENLNYSELIWEFGNDQKPDWVHIAFSIREEAKKQTTLIAYIDGNGKRQYTPFEWEKLKSLYC